MKTEKPVVDNLTISFADLGAILKRSKRKILFVTLATALLAAIFALTSHIRYRAESSFQEKSSRSVEANASLFVMLSGLSETSSENGAFVVMHSRKLIEPVIEALGLQARVSYRGQGEEDGILSRIIKNLKLELHSYSFNHTPLLSDPTFPLQVRPVVYHGEVPLYLSLKILSDDDFEVLDQAGNTVGHGVIGTPFIANDYQFTVLHREYTSLLPGKYQLTFFSMNTMYKGIESALHIESDKKDKNLLKLEFRHYDRHVAAAFLNKLMAQYEQYLQNKQDEQSEVQLAYLRRRQGETRQSLNDLMQNHAERLSADYSNVGFADSQKEMEFLTLRQQRFQEQLFANQLEIKRLQNVNTDRCVYYDQHASYGDPVIINKILAEIRDIKLQRNSLELALRQDPQPTNLVGLHILFAKQIDELANIQQQSADVNAILASLTEDQDPDPSLAIFNDSTLLINPWLSKLNDKKIAYNRAEKGERELRRKEWQTQKEHFIAYLENLQRMTSVHEKVIQERLTHHQNPGMEFQGIDLKTANELYINYSKLLNNIEANIRQNTFVVKQIEDPNFEISSLSSTLDDPVGRETVVKSSQLIKDLHDDSNRSTKEQERIKEELALQREFLGQHLRQTTQLEELTHRLYREKINSLQNVTLELINQQISVLNDNFIAFIAERLENLKQERLLLEQHTEEIQQQMATLPKKWVTEKLIQQELETSRLIVEEISKLIEKKNVSHNLQLVLSAPLDIALVPLNPLPPRLLAYMMMGAILGGLLSVSFVSVRSMVTGFPVTPEGLGLSHQYVAGCLSRSYPSKPLLDQDLSTLRRLQRYFQSGVKISEKALLLMEGHGPDYAGDFAAMLAKEGMKVVRLSLDFDKVGDAGDLPGLLQVLEGQASSPKVVHGNDGDTIAVGGVTRFSIELLRSSRFQTLLKQLQTEYDWVIASTHASLHSSEAESLAALFPALAVTVTHENRQDLLAYLPGGVCSDKKTAFVFADT